MYNVSLDFTWDNEKAARNRRKHGVSFDEAESVFYDPFVHCYFDIDHAGQENRFLLLGRSRKERVLVVSHIELTENIVRTISARLATRKEQIAYSRKIR